MTNVFLSIIVAFLAWALRAESQARTDAPSVAAKPGEWRYLNHDPLSTRYSPLDQINKDNFKDLKVAWRWKPAIGPAPSSLGGTAQGNGDPTLAIYRNESTPIMANGVLYTAAGGQRVVAAIDAATAGNCGCGREWMRAAATARRRGETRGAALRIGRTARTSGFLWSRPASFSWPWMPGPACRCRH